ncbi:MAG: hypothetical protein RMJ56_06455 [Gemmataceae bacterium]|nr:hypothetical protein [Gemmata sp.]MDW8197231.1 hypothetical protein [Gemmataceae bacterium]
MRRLFCALTLLTVSSLAVADDKPAVKEIDTKDFKLAVDRDGKPTAPTEIKTADELAKNAALKEAAEAIKKHVNFEKEKLVLFAWGGSGGDRITADAKNPGTFNYSPGFTRDYRLHVKLFVVPKDAVVKVVTVRQ